MGDALWDKDRDASKEFQDRLVRLYAVYNQRKLMSFLELGDRLNLEEALDACQEHGLTHEQIFIYTRMGNPKKALELILDELIDIDEAIRFCKERDDEELWDMLVDYAVDKPGFVYRLLTSIGTHVDPKILISKIAPGQVIPGLKHALATIMQDYRLQKDLQEACKKIVESDAYTLINKQEEMQKRGVSVTSELTCGGCGRSIVDSTQIKDERVFDSESAENPHQDSGDVLIFMCRHAFHSQCIHSTAVSCNLCKVKRF